MRSSWVHLSFHRATASGLVITQSPGQSVAVSPPHKTASSQRIQALRTAASPAHPRLCLGIGDGAIHRQ
jgi:hypothetical protein